MDHRMDYTIYSVTVMVTVVSNSRRSKQCAVYAVPSDCSSVRPFVTLVHCIV